MRMRFYVHPRLSFYKRGNKTHILCAMCIKGSNFASKSKRTAHMKLKGISRWLLMLFTSFLMYEALWSIIEFQLGDVSYSAEGVLWDFSQCVLFTLVVFVVNWGFSKFRGGRYARGVAEIITLLIVNAFVIFLTDKIVNEQDANDVDFWSVVDIYVICVICSLLSIINIQHSYHKQFMVMEKKQTLLRLNLLQQQLSPHFMFNSLSTLQGMIAADSEKAEDYVATLSDAMRYITENIGKERIALPEALRFIENYVKMQETRFFGHFLFSIDTSGIPHDAYIVPVSLQLAVENAIKHNKHSCKHPLEIKISFSQGYIEVSNKKQPTAYEDGLGVGLKNLSERYKLLIGKELDVSETTDFYTVKIPLIYESLDSRR